MTTTKGTSLASLNKRNTPAVEFEYITPGGERTGLFFSILGSHTSQVTAEVNRLVNDRRRQQAADEAAAVAERRTYFTPIENEIEFAQRLAAVRLSGWRGIDDAFTPEAAVELCQGDPDISTWIIAKSNALGFTSQASQKAS